MSIYSFETRVANYTDKFLREGRCRPKNYSSKIQDKDAIREAVSSMLDMLNIDHVNYFSKLYKPFKRNTKYLGNLASAWVNSDLITKSCKYEIDPLEHYFKSDHKLDALTYAFKGGLPGSWVDKTPKFP